ncbi:MAG: DUF4876 domain-containing protein [Prevotella sp.]|nr:DUF4876 domain-containing protein [Prevotella sp.]
MKKSLLIAFAFVAMLTHVSAQSWNMIITHEDGKTDTLQTAAVKNVTFTRADFNADKVIIKEIYNGGVMKDDNSGNFQFDKCIILYNNGGEVAVLNNLCIAIAAPYNAEGMADKLYVDGKLVYEDENFIPAQNGIWYFPNSLVIQPYSQVVVNVHGAIDNTKTVSNSINYANKDYYCMYDPNYVGGAGENGAAGSYNNTNYYPAPADVIPTSHYLKTVKYGQANAWPFSVVSPAVYIFQTKAGQSPVQFGENAENLWYIPGYGQTVVFACVKVPREWVLDGVEVWNAAMVDKSMKRLTADIDAGYVTLTSKQGHVLYRNVDKAATEALAENAGKLVYNYTLGASNTDPSGIDAEASMKKGAHIIFQDTNNSTNDFHERLKCSLRGE